MHFIYVVENKMTGKCYVGQTICPKNRRKQHLSRTPHGNPFLDRAVLKYGRENFDFSIIEELETLEDANSREAYWITHLGTLAPCGYNLKEGGASGGPDSPETRLKKSLAKRGNKNSFYGKKHSEETKTRISISKTGAPVDIPASDIKRRRDYMTNLNKGRTGVSLSAEHRVRIGNGQRGRTHSEETKRKMSEARRKWWSARKLACQTN